MNRVQEVFPCASVSLRVFLTIYISLLLHASGARPHMTYIVLVGR